jgi:putative phosphoesterase
MFSRPSLWYTEINARFILFISFCDDIGSNFNRVKLLKTIEKSGAYRLYLHTNFKNMKRYVIITAGGTGTRMGADRPKQLLELEGKRLFLIHGWQSPLSSLTYRAMEKNADVLLFGHTHCRYQSFVRDEASDRELHLFNPGSASLPRDGLPPSFGILEIRNSQMLFSHGDIDRRLLG